MSDSEELINNPKAGKLVTRTRGEKGQFLSNKKKRITTEEVTQAKRKLLNKRVKLEDGREIPRYLLILEKCISILENIEPEGIDAKMVSAVAQLYKVINEDTFSRARVSDEELEAQKEDKPTNIKAIIIDGSQITNKIEERKAPIPPQLEPPTIEGEVVS